MPARCCAQASLLLLLGLPFACGLGLIQLLLDHGKLPAPISVAKGEG